MTTSLGLLAVFLAIISYSIYIYTIFKGHTKPHSITWLIWAMLNSFIYIQQLSHDAGPGAWVTGIAALANAIIFLISLKYGERSLTRLDWFCLIFALGVFILWMQRASDVLTIILASTIFIIGFVPTIYKSFSKPAEETIITFGLNSLKFFIALFALTNFTITTALYPLVLAITNASFVIFLLVQRHLIHRQADTN